MGREKRKTRLDKGSTSTSGGDFVGFSAFAAHAASSATLKWSPVYAGSDSQLSLVFKRISQKREGVTKVRALNELQSFLQDETMPKKEKVSALAHLVFLYHSKLSYDDFASVRAAAISCLTVAYHRLPKVWKTLVFEQQPELWGMLWCAQADITAEVRTVAKALCDVVAKGAGHEGIVTYVTRLLRYERPRNLHDALFTRKSNDSSTRLSETEQEQMEERFERILGTALSGMELWIRQHPETNEGNLYQDSFHDGTLLKLLTSSRSSFRRKTYALVAILCQHAKSVVHGDIGSSILPKALTSVLVQEKEASNIPSLLEAVLLYVNSFPEGSNAWGTMDSSLVTKYLNKLLRKACYGASANVWGPTMLPLVASIQDDSLSLQRQLLSSMWAGREATIGPSDSLYIGASVAECASFFLLRREEEPISSDVAKEFANIWLQVLRTYLLTHSITKIARRADRGLLVCLAKDLHKLDESSNSRPNCAMYSIRRWFWDEAMRSIVLNSTGLEVTVRLTMLLQVIMANRKKLITLVDNPSVELQSNCNPVIREKFHSILSKYQIASNRIPDIQAYDMLSTSLKFCGASFVFATSSSDEDGKQGATTIEQFLVNDLMRWIVIHTSSLSSDVHNGTSGALAKQDFSLLRVCLPSVPSPLKQKSLWESILREITAANCDLSLLSMGLAVLADESGSDSSCVDVLRCETLDKFAMQVAMDAGSQYRSLVEQADEVHADNESDGMEKRIIDANKIRLFLQTCVGLGPGAASILVSKRVVHEWVNVASPKGISRVFATWDVDAVESPLLDTLVSIVSMRDEMLDRGDTVRIMLEAWRQGGSIWSEKAIPILMNGDKKGADSIPLWHDVVRQGSAELQEMVMTFSGSGVENRSDVVLACHAWSDRAYRVLDLSRNASNEADEEETFDVSLKMVGLGDLSQWHTSLYQQRNAATLHLYLCLIFLLEQIDTHQERLQLLLETGDSSATLVVNVLLVLSDANEITLVDPMRRKDHRVVHFFELLGGKAHIPWALLETWCRELVMTLASEMSASGKIDLDRIFKGVSVLSTLIGQMFDDVHVGIESDIVKASDIHVGEVLWYVPTQENEQQREEVRVIKVHSDDFPRLYFTVQPEGENAQERQTVSERLRRFASPPVKLVLNEEEQARQIYGSLIVAELVMPFASLGCPEKQNLVVDAAAECASIAIAQCGLLGKAGLGSTRYEVFRWLSLLQNQFTELLLGPDSDYDVLPLLRTLSLALGLGNVAPSSTRNFTLLSFNPQDSVSACVKHYETATIAGSFSEFDQAVLGWLTIAIGAIDESNLRAQCKFLLYRLAASALRETRSGSSDLSVSLSALRALAEAQRAAAHSQNSDGTDNEYEFEMLVELIRVFASEWRSDDPNVLATTALTLPQERHPKPIWYEPFQLVISDVLDAKNEFVGKAARSCADSLVDALFDPNKQWCAFRLLNSCAGATNGIPLYDKDPAELDAGTKKRVMMWQNGLEVEEAEELEGDVRVVTKWVPRHLMTEIEQWHEDEADEDVDTSTDELTGTGRMLSWLSLLPFIDSAASADVTNRGAVSSYVQCCGAVHSILNLVLSYLEISNDRSSMLGTLITTVDGLRCEELELSKLSALVMFRTVEVFPTLTKHWWEEACPRALSSAVSQFVQANVAPETLRRELLRIGNATNLGEMTVTGSIVSREVTATYMQDECQLSVVIQIPPTFPLRNVDVDGRKTLGIPEKRWKRWALQIRLMLNNQDGTLLDALMLWKENVDKEFEGVEPCPVCYSVLSVKTHQLPNLECKTCKNCFHSGCLYKWFHSSGKNQCVLCQQPWSGTRLQ